MTWETECENCGATTAPSGWVQLATGDVLPGLFRQDDFPSYACGWPCAAHLCIGYATVDEHVRDDDVRAAGG